MRTPVQSVRTLDFTSVRTLTSPLRRAKPSPAAYGKLVSDSFRRGSRHGRTMVRALLRVDPDVEARRRILIAVRRTRKPLVRRHVVRAFIEESAELDLITGLSVMTTRDAGNFFREYFRSGGTIASVGEWLSEMSAMYARAKARGEVTPEFLGFWDDAWDAVISAGSSIGDAISTVVNAVLAAGKTFADVVGDILTYPQRRINAIVEALLDAGRTVGELIDGAMTAGLNFVRRTFKAILAAGRAVGEILEHLFTFMLDFLRDGLALLITIGVRIKTILADAWDLGMAILQEAVEQLIALGHTVWYILRWAVKGTYTLLKGVVEKLWEIGTEIGGLLLWFGKRAFAIAKQGIEVLLAVGYTLGEMLYVLLTDPEQFIQKSLKALLALGKSVYELLESVASLGPELLQHLYRTLLAIGMSLAQMLAFLVVEGKDLFIEGVTWLLKAGVRIFDVLLWALQRSYDVFSWAMSAVDTMVGSFLDVMEWAAGIGGPVVSAVARWLGEFARDAFDWFKTKVIEPVLQAGKIVLLIGLGLVSIVFLAVAYYTLKSLVDMSATDYLQWPASFSQFRASLGNRLIQLPPVDADHKYVLVSDLHMEDTPDVNAGLGHFYKNKKLIKDLLARYAGDPTWTVLSNGDEQEFWYNADLEYLDNPDKLDKIIDRYGEIFETLSESFYKYTSPRRYVKFRGNHDSNYDESGSLARFQDNGFPDLRVYDYALTSRNGKPILIMHGMQFDPYNCDANNFFGKFVSNFIAEPFDEVNDLIVDIFGSGADTEGWQFAPYFQRSEWDPMINSDVASPSISSGFTFDENPIVDKIREYGCSIIIGHTHEPKLIKDAQDGSRFYANTGTSGWWQGCIWTVELTPEDVTLNAWTSDDSSAPYRSFKLSETTATFP